MFLANLFAADRSAQSASKAKSRRRHLALDCLEERKVLSTATTAGSFDNMAWLYSYDNVAKTGTFTVTDRPDGHTIHINAAHPNLSLGDPGYSASHANDITGIQLSDEKDQEGGPSIVVGTKVNIVVKMDKGDNVFKNDVSSFAYSTVARTGSGTGSTAGTTVSGLAAQAQSGTADGLVWSYSYTASTKKWSLTVVDRAGSDPETMKVVGGKVQFTSAKGGTFTGPTIATGTGVTGSITLLKDTGDKAVNNSTGYSMTTSARTTTTTGTALGLSWRFVQDNSSSAGNGNLFVQSVARGSNTADAKNDPIAINQKNGHIIFDVDISKPANGPAVKSTAKINVVVGENKGSDIHVYNDGLVNATTTYTPRTQTGNISVSAGSLGWTFTQNVVTQQATFTVASGKTDRATYSIASQTRNLRPSDPGYQADSNPVTGIVVSDSGNGQGGVSFTPGTVVTIKTSGGATWKNSSDFAMSPA